MNNELAEEEKQIYDDARCAVDVGRLKKAKSDKERIIIIKTIINNFVLEIPHAIRFLEELREWTSILNMTLLLSYKVPEELRDEFCQQVMENKAICKFPEDKKALEGFLDYEFKQKEEAKKEGPIVVDNRDKDDYYKWKDL